MIVWGLTGNQTPDVCHTGRTAKGGMYISLV